MCKVEIINTDKDKRKKIFSCKDKMWIKIKDWSNIFGVNTSWKEYQKSYKKKKVYKQ